MGAGGAIGLSLLPSSVRAADGVDLNFYSWDSYIGETTLADFEDQTALRVHTDVYADNEELLDNLKNGSAPYDVIVPSSDVVQRMIAADLLMPLDHADIPNMANLHTAFLDAGFEPKRRHTVPYSWRALGIGYRKSKVDAAPDSWRWILDSDRHAGRIALLDEAAPMLGAAMKYLGHSLNNLNAEPLMQAAELLTRQKPHIVAFASDEGQDLLLSGQVDIAMEWSADISQVMGEDPDISFVIPREGSVIWQDTMAIPATAPHPKKAHDFINFILEARTGADIAEFLHIATPNKAARSHLSVEYNQNPTLGAPEDVLARCEHILRSTPEAMAQRMQAWKHVRSE